VVLDRRVALCLGLYGGPGVGAVSDERGTPVRRMHEKLHREVLSAEHSVLSVAR